MVFFDLCGLYLYEIKEDGMGGEMGYLQRMPAIGWIGCYPLTWHGCTDVRLRMWDCRDGNGAGHFGYPPAPPLMG